ncbi:Hsp33 family molecular chaperone HslO [Thiobacillus denitrificans]|uniref:Disulfide bond formation protein n=1 Tax=Thiobacillus denitrificans TaxID=36861 RepID=A0A106BJ27_THIDE|nr:Hsp33 family molecular chaperone HslO [Thiobacillus denitrificans]KVW93345.1 disulfide bond formation protein [Thiobacillus denitrificans]
MKPADPQPNRVRSFLFEQLDIRGAWVQLGPAWREMIAGRDYPEPVVELLGQLAGVATLITANLKQAGRLTFQLRGEGAVSLLVMDCDEQLHLRGMARTASELSAGSLPALLGDGALTLTLDTAGMRQPYQSHVPLQGDTVAAVFEHYLTQSEQTPTRLWLAANHETAAGLFLQALPGAAERDADGWNRVQILADTVRADELLGLGSIKLIERLFPEEGVRVFDPRPVSYHCPYDSGKIEAMLRGIGRAECESILAEHGEIRVHDDVCNHEYVLDTEAVAALFK